MDRTIFLEFSEERAHQKQHNFSVTVKYNYKNKKKSIKNVGNGKTGEKTCLVGRGG